MLSQSNLVIVNSFLPKDEVSTKAGQLQIAVLSDSGALALRCTAAGIHRKVQEAVFYRPSREDRIPYGVDW